MNGTATPLVIGVTSHRNIPAREEAGLRQRVRDFRIAESDNGHDPMIDNRQEGIWSSGMSDPIAPR